MLKKTVSLFLAVFLSLALIGCGGKKKELTKEQREHFESLAQLFVSLEVYENYGIQPGITVDDLTANDIKQPENYPYTRTNFTAKGSYTLRDESGTLYSGTFTVKGYTEGHGDGCDSCKITPPRNGLKTLPKIDPASTTTTSETTTVETTVLELNNDVMINLSKQFKSDGYTVEIFDPSKEYEKCYGAKEAFRAHTSNKLVYVYLYDTKEEAENGEYMMYKNTEGTVNGVVKADTYFIHDKVLVAEITR